MNKSNDTEQKILNLTAKFGSLQKDSEFKNKNQNFIYIHQTFTTKKNLSEVQTEIDTTAYHIHEELPGYKIDRKNSVQLPELVTITASPELYEPSLI